jgi:hypothetical protein
VRNERAIEGVVEPRRVDPDALEQVLGLDVERCDDR